MTVTVDAAGGKVSLTGRQGQASGVPFSLDIPPGALPGPTTLTITETTLAPPAGYVDYSPVYLVEPLDTTFAHSVPIVVPWGNVSGTVSQSLALYTAPDASSPFTRLADSYTNAGFEQGSVTQGGLFFVGYPTTDYNPTCP